MSDISKDWMIGALKASLWEEAKGKMRAIVAVGGQCSPLDYYLVERYRDGSNKIEAFIKDFEDHALHE